MKRILIVFAVCLMIGACSSTITENRESRSTVYVGQTTWDLYENFGVPTKAERISPDEIHFHYHREMITREWTEMFYDWCDMTFVVVNDRVSDWWVSGNQCTINERVTDASRTDKATPAAKEDETIYTQNEDAYYPEEEYQDTLF